MGSKINPARVARAFPPPEQVAAVKAVACELPVRYGLPLGRFSRTELYRLVIELAVTYASASTIWRWLHEDAIKPWQQRCWIYRRDPAFGEKAGRALDLYARVFEGKRLRPDEYVISADEKSQLQALGRRDETSAPGPGRPSRYEFEYECGGDARVARAATSSSTSAAGDARVPRRVGRAPRAPVRSRRAEDRNRAVRPTGGAGHEGRAVRLRPHRVLDRRQRLLPGRQDLDPADAEALAQRAADPPPRARLLAKPKIELYCSIVQRKALTPNDLAPLDALAERLLAFGEQYRQIARPFELTFTPAKTSTT